LGYVVDKVAWDRISVSEFFGFPLSVSFHQGSLYECIIWRMNNRPIRGNGLETVSLHLHEQQLQRLYSIKKEILGDCYRRVWNEGGIVYFKVLVFA
jgi:hypothetical protein